jgi:hypothetical protein
MDPTSKGSVTLIHPEDKFTTPIVQAITKFNLFQSNPTLLATPYPLKSSVTLSIFREFVSAFEGNAVKITNTNFAGLQQLCEEFGFHEFAAKLSEFEYPNGFEETQDARTRITELEEKIARNDDETAILQNQLIQLSTDFERLVGEVSTGIQTLSEEVSALKTQIGQKVNDPVVEQLSTEFNELRKEVLTLKTQIEAMSLTVTPTTPQPSRLSTSTPSQRRPLASVPPTRQSSQSITSTPSQKQPSPPALQPSPLITSSSSQNQPPPPTPPSSQQPPVPSFDSQIISDFPEIFAEFRKKQISLLWRGQSRWFQSQRISPPM